MKREQLTFLCGVCKRKPEIKLEEKENFQIVAYENIMEWSDFTEEVPGLDIRIWGRTMKTPVKGEIKKVQVYFPFSMEVGEKFWTLFMPALSNFNGWDEHPEEINTSAIIKCCFKSIISRNDERAWINIEVEEVLLLSDICNHFFPEEDKGYLNSLNDFRNISMYDYGEWIEFIDGTQGNLGTWGLVKKHKDGTNSLVLYGQSDLHLDTLYCGNIFVSKDDLNDLIKLASK